MEPKGKGRPTTYTPEIIERLCNKIATSSKGLKAICRLKGMPKYSTVFKWLSDPTKKDFVDKYTRAREAQADFLADEIIEIADDGSNDTIKIKKGEDIIEVENREWTNRSKLRVDARKWKASKLAPKKYGDKVDLTSDGEKINSQVHVFLPDNKR